MFAIHVSRLGSSRCKRVLFRASIGTLGKFGSGCAPGERRARLRLQAVFPMCSPTLRQRCPHGEGTGSQGRHSRLRRRCHRAENGGRYTDSLCGACGRQSRCGRHSPSLQAKWARRNHLFPSSARRYPRGGGNGECGVSSSFDDHLRGRLEIARARGALACSCAVLPGAARCFVSSRVCDHPVWCSLTRCA